MWNDIETEEKTRTSEPSAISKWFASLSLKRKAYTVVASLVVIAATLLLLLTYGGVLGKTSGGMTPQAIREIAEFATLEFYYSDVIVIVEEQEFKLFGLWDIDPGESILVVKYDGIIKLGIDSKEMKFTESASILDGKKRVEIQMPEIKIISSEIPQDSFEIIVNRGVYTKTKIELGAFFDAAATRQAQHDAEALETYSQLARDSAKKHLESLFEQYDPGDNYDIVWVD